MTVYPPGVCPYANFGSLYDQGNSHNSNLDQSHTQESHSHEAAVDESSSHEKSALTGSSHPHSRFEGTPVWRHVASFTPNSGVATAKTRLTDESIAKRQEQLNDKGFVANRRRAAVLTAGGDEPTVENYCEFVASNLASSGIWDDNGQVVIPRLQRLRQVYADEINGTIVVTRKKFQEFINERRNQVNTSSWQPHAYALGKLKGTYIPHVLVTDGSVDALYYSYGYKYGCQVVLAWDKIVEFYDPNNTAKTITVDAESRAKKDSVVLETKQ